MKKTAALFLSALLLQTAVFTGCADDTESADAWEEREDMLYGTGLEIGSMETEYAEEPERRLYRKPTSVGFKPAVTMSGAALGEIHYWYRNTLTQEGKRAYDQIRAGVLQGMPSIDLTVPLTADEAFRIYQMVIMDGPELFYASDSATCLCNDDDLVLSIQPVYHDLAEDIPGNTRLMKSAVADAIGAMRKLKEPLQQVKYAHDYLLHTVEYQPDAMYDQTCFGALVDGESTCAGYAHAFQYLMQQMNIPCAYVVGEAGEPHAWNLLRLYDEVYTMDVTWDDPIDSSDDSYSYTFFNVTDQAVSRSHVRGEISALLPQGLGTACSYENGFGGHAVGTDFSGDHPPVIHLPKPTAAQTPAAAPAPLDKPDHTWWNEDIWNDTQWVQEEDDWGEVYPDDEPYPEDEDWEEEAYWDDDEDWDEFWGDDEDWEDFWDDDEDWNDDDFWDLFWEDADEEDDLDWWNLLDSNWTEEDWDELDDGCYEIYDEDTDCCYTWCDRNGTFRARDESTGEELILDMESGNWLTEEN